jgi:cyclopropane fatty-acyl-phospholipid synthase-like methyltransferase
MYKDIKKCRICGNTELIKIIVLGRQCLTGVFPKSKGQTVPSGKLELIKCEDDKNPDSCGLLQLSRSYSLGDMYGDNYGYRSGLNQSMVDHLSEKTAKIEKIAGLSSGDLVLDIGSNDSTLLRSYSKRDIILAGIDPTGEKFRKYYPDKAILIPDFFSSRAFIKKFGNKKAKVITSIAMFYDLESPLDFMTDIYDSLDDEGIWVFEQSYMPAMLEMNSYDTICHEHLEYYSLKQIRWMAERAGFKLIDVEINGINGGSFSVTAAKLKSHFSQNNRCIQKILSEEAKKKLTTKLPYKKFEENVKDSREKLIKTIAGIKKKNKTIIGYGASTKGNVILQFCGISAGDIPFIAEVNEEKYGCFTPGTRIPIIPEREARLMNPDYFMVLPWHFRQWIISKEKQYIKSGGKLLFPLPKVEVCEK